MKRSELKAQARDRISHAKPSPVLAGLFYVIIIALISLLSYKLVGEPISNIYQEYFNVDQIQAQSFSELFDSIDLDSLAYDIQHNGPNGTARLLDMLLTVMSLVVGVGMMIFSLNTLRGKNASCWNLFDGFSMFGRIFVLYLLEGIFIFLWSLLFFFPGIIAYYRYSQAIYLLIDHPEMSPMECIRESSRIMCGHKWERFVLDLSFIGWLFLMSFLNGAGSVFGIPIIGTLIGIWFYPFFHLTLAGYYRNLTGDDIPDNDGWVPEV